MKKTNRTNKKALILLAFSLLTTSAFAVQTQVNFSEGLSDSDCDKIAFVAEKIIAKDSVNGTALHGFFESGSEESESFTIRNLIEDPQFFNESMPAMVKDGNKEEAKKSFLNLLGFAGKDFRKSVDVKSALDQALPTFHIRTVDGINNIFFENPAFTDSQLAETINYYDSLLRVKHFVPTCVSKQKNHDNLLAYAFQGKGNAERLKMNGLSRRGQDGARLPIVELIGKYLAKKLVDAGTSLSSEKFVFSGSGFAGAIAQEVAYQVKKLNTDLGADKVKVVTSQAMRYLSGDFAKDYDNVLGKDNVFSINTGRKHEIGLPGINYKSVYFNALGTQVRLDTQASTNGLLDGVFWKLGWNKDRYDENHKGVIFKTPDTSEVKVQKILGGVVPKANISNAQFTKLTPILVDHAKNQTQSSSNALATLLVNDMFLKTSKGRAEHDNLVKIRKQFGIKENVPTLKDMGNKASMVIPASYYDPIHDVTVTVAHAAGDKSAHDSLKNILGRSDFKIAAAKNGQKLGQILASLHQATGSVSHGDFHLNNIRFDKDGNAYVIDVETLAKNYVDGNVRDSNGFRDILDLIAKTTSHIYKSGTYGASKGVFNNFFGKEPSDTEKAFALAVMRGYVKSLSKEARSILEEQYKVFKDKYHSNVNKYLNGGFFSTYNNAIFTEVFEGKTFEEMLKGNEDLLRSVVFDRI